MIGVAAISMETTAPTARRSPRESFYPGPIAGVRESRFDERQGW
jgi:hypothetical protein